MTPKEPFMLLSSASQRTDWFIMAGMSFATFGFLMLTSLSASYGYFIDEVYYLACSNRLDFGYVDHPPLSIFLLAINRLVFGDSVMATRLLPALAAAGNVFLTGLLAQSLGGSRSTIIIASLAATAMPVLMLMGSFYSMNAFEPLLVSAILFLLVRMVQREEPRYWLIVGALAGVGLGFKHTMVVYLVALVIGLLATRTRRLLWNRWLLLGVILCAVLILPNVLWQFAHGFPSLEFYRNAMMNKNVPRSPLEVVFDQLVFSNPFSAPLWLAGVGALLFAGWSRRFRFLGWTYLVLLTIMFISQSSRPDRISAMYPILFAAGAVALTRIGSIPLRRWGLGLMTVSLVTGAFVFAPVMTPLLPPPQLRTYLRTIGFAPSIERGKMDEPIPQWLADRLGWKELAADVAMVVRSLPPDERANAVIVSTNYGEAGALEVYGEEFGLPPVYATHNTYHLWGPPPDSARVFIGVYVSGDDLQRFFGSVHEAAVHTCEDCTRPQRRIPIYVARAPKLSIREAWPRFKIYN